MNKSKAVDPSLEMIRETIAKVTPNLGKAEQKKQEEILQKVFSEGQSLKDSLKVSDQTLEFLYSQAYRLYKIGKYKDSSRYFHLLYLFNCNDLRYSLGVAACYHMQKEYMKAIQWYLVCAALDAVSPLPYYHISDCFLKLGNKLSALISLKMMEVRLNDDPVFTQIKERASRMMETLSAELKKTQKSESNKESAKTEHKIADHKSKERVI